MARKLIPEGPHTLTALIYRLFEDKQQAREWVKSAHNAQADVEMTLWLLRQLVKLKGDLRSWEELWQVSEAARILDVIPFGKHKDTPIKDLPADYVKWYRAQVEKDPYLITAMAKHFA